MELQLKYYFFSLSLLIHFIIIAKSYYVCIKSFFLLNLSLPVHINKFINKKQLFLFIFHFKIKKKIFFLFFFLPHKYIFLSRWSGSKLNHHRWLCRFKLKTMCIGIVHLLNSRNSRQNK